MSLKYFFDLFLSVFLCSLFSTLVLNVRPLKRPSHFLIFSLLSILDFFSKLSARFINLYLFLIRFIFQFFCHVFAKSNKKQETVSDEYEYFLYLFEDINKLLIFSSLYNCFVQVTLVCLYQLLPSYCFL